MRQRHGAVVERDYPTFATVLANRYVTRGHVLHARRCRAQARFRVEEKLARDDNRLARLEAARHLCVAVIFEPDVHVHGTEVAACRPQG